MKPAKKRPASAAKVKRTVKRVKRVTTPAKSAQAKKAAALAASNRAGTKKGGKQPKSAAVRACMISPLFSRHVSFVCVHVHVSVGAVCHRLPHVWCPENEVWAHDCDRDWAAFSVYRGQ